MHVCTSDAHNRRNVLKREKCKFASWSVELKGIIGCWGRSNLPRQLLQVIENCTRNVCTRYHQHRATSGSLHFAREPAPIPTGIAINVVSFGIRLFPIVADWTETLKESGQFETFKTSIFFLFSFCFKWYLRNKMQKGRSLWNDLFWGIIINPRVQWICYHCLQLSAVLQSVNRVIQILLLASRILGDLDSI